MSEEHHLSRVRIVSRESQEAIPLRPTRVRIVNKLLGSRVRIISDNTQEPQSSTSRVRILGEPQTGTDDYEAAITNRNQRLRTELAGIDELFLGVNTSSPIRLEQHHAQRYLSARDGSGIDSCVVACTVNVLTALGFDETDEDTIIAALGGTQSFAAGRLDVTQARDYLRQVGVASATVHPVLEDNLSAMLTNLEDGGFAILAYGGHARLISGFDICEGDVSLRVNDPLNTKMQEVPLVSMVNDIEATGTYHNLLLIRPAADYV